MRRAVRSIPALLLAVCALQACTSTAALGPDPMQPVGPTVSLAPTTDASASAASALLPPPGGATIPPPAGPATPAPAAPAMLAPAAPAAIPSAAALSNVRLQFAPVVGATVEAASPLSSRLSKRAAERGLGITADAADPARLMMKGYFSAITEGKDTIVIFVWDVIGTSGNRLHRIQGQEKISGTRREAWAAVTPRAMEAIADRTIDELAQWLSTRPT